MNKLEFEISARLQVVLDVDEVPHRTVTNVMLSCFLFRSLPHAESHTGRVASSSRSQLEDHTPPQPWTHTAPQWQREPLTVTEEQLLDEELLRAGILASLRDAPEGTAADKVEVQKSSVSSLRCVMCAVLRF